MSVNQCCHTATRKANMWNQQSMNIGVSHWENSIWNTAVIPGHPLSRRINWNRSKWDNDQTNGDSPAGGTGACLAGKRKGIQKVSKNTSRKSKHQGKKNIYIRESGIRWKSKLVTNNINVDDRIWLLWLRRPRLACHPSTSAGTRSLPGIHATGSLQWRIAPYRAAERQDTVLRGPVCSQRRRQALAAGGMNTTRIPSCERSACFNQSSAALPRPWIKCYICGNATFCSQQCPSPPFSFSSTVHSSHLTEKLSMSTWLLSFIHWY